MGILFFISSSAREGLEKSNVARMSATGEGWTEPNIYFCPLGRNVNESLPVYHVKNTTLGIQ